MALHAAGIDFEDYRIDFSDFGDAKRAGKYATGLPELVLPGESGVLTQSCAIARYASKKAGLYPTDDIEALKCDEVMDLCQDALGKSPNHPDQKVKKQKRTEYAQTKLKSFFSTLESRVAGPFVLGSELCIADLTLYYFLLKMLRDEQFDFVACNYADDYPKLVALEEAVGQHAIVQEWMEQHKSACKS